VELESSVSCSQQVHGNSDKDDDSGGDNNGNNNNNNNIRVLLQRN
jgi:hypothetical protein